MKIRAIAGNTFKEAVRDRVLYVIAFFAVICIGLSRILAILTVGDRVKIIEDVGLASLSIFGVLMSIMVGTGLVYKEIDKKTIFTLLSKPIHRFQFLLGKFIGLVMTLLIMFSGMSLIFLGLVYFHTFSIEWRLLIPIVYIFIEMCLITSVALLFSCFSTPILSSLFTLGFFIIGHFSWGLDTLIVKIKSGFWRGAANAAYTFLPDLENFNFKTEVIHNLPIAPQIYVFSLLYGAAYTAFVLALAILVFRKRDFI